MDTISLSTNNHIAEIQFNRPQVMNTYNDQMAHELANAVEQVAHDDDIKACILRGVGPCFMAGGDIHYFQQNMARLADKVESLMALLESTIQNLITMPKPVLACAHGSVAGVGMSFLAASDLVLATSDCIFTMAYSHLGLTPDGAASYVLPRVIGHKRAMEWMMLSERLDAKTVQAAGLINWVVEPSEFEDSIKAKALRLAQGNTHAFGNLKHLMHSTWENSLAQQLAAEAKSFIQCTQGDEFKQAVKAFLK